MGISKDLNVSRAEFHIKANEKKSHGVGMANGCSAEASNHVILA